MDKTLRLKSWQIFLLIFSLPLIFYYLLTSASNQQGRDAILTFSPLLAVILFGAILIWLYAMAKNLQAKQIPLELLEIRNFKIAFLIFVSYITFNLLLVLYIVNIEYSEWKLFLDLISQGAYLYMVWFISKSLKTVELNKEALFSEYVLTLIMLWMFPVGIWFIQPRINKVFVLDNGQ